MRKVQVINYIIILVVLLGVCWMYYKEVGIPSIEWRDEYGNNITNLIIHYGELRCDYGVLYRVGRNGTITPAYKSDGMLVMCYSVKIGMQNK